MYKKILFLDRDGTLIDEPEDNQVDQLQKLALKKNVIPALLKLQQAGYSLIMISNQDGLGTSNFPRENFLLPQNMLLNIFSSQGIYFKDILICPHIPTDYCDCRKPKIGLLIDYLKNNKIDFIKSYVIGDRETDVEFAKNIGIKSIFYTDQDWLDIAKQLITAPRTAEIQRITNETKINIAVNLDQNNKIDIKTGLGFFDHMLEQLAKHAGFNLEINASGDLAIDEHHTVEDTAICLGQAIRQALGDKLGINRYGFLLPMDESSAEIALDLSGRGLFIFQGKFSREKIGDLPTELISHFFRSFAENLAATLHIKVQGENVHHMIESIFKGVGRSLAQAIKQKGNELPTTKGVL